MRRILLGSTLPIMLAMLPAWAQTEPTEQGSPTPTAADEDKRDVVVVTARKREERLNDVPIAATVTTADDLNARGATNNTADVLSGVAGLNFAAANNPSLAAFTIRGSGSAIQTTGGSPGVGMFRNGLLANGGVYFSQNFTRADFFDLQQVEVLRGVQGALYGRNAVGGAVNVVSARPTFSDSGFVSFDYNPTVEKYEGQFVVNRQLSDTDALRIGANIVDQSEGEIYDRTSRGYFDEDHGGVGRLQFRHKDGPLDVTFLVERLDEKLPTNSPQVANPPGTPGFIAGYTQPQYVRAVSVAPTNISKLTTSMLNGTYDLTFGELAFNTLYRDSYTRSASDVDLFTPVTLAEARAIPGNTGIGATGPVDTGQNLFLTVRTEILNQEIHLAGSSDQWTWLVGGEYLHLSSGLDSLQTRTAGPVIDAFSKVSWISYAAFASLGYAIVPDLVNLTVDGRYTDDRKNMFRVNHLAPFTYVLPPTDVDNTNFSYSVILDYHLTPDVLAFAKVGTAYRVGGANLVPLVPSPPAPIAQQILYDDETSTQFEVGVKGSPLPGTFIGLSAYVGETEGAIVPQSSGCTVAICGRIVPAALVNGGDAKSLGDRTRRASQGRSRRRTVRGRRNAVAPVRQVGVRRV
ncbi:MAG: TonB-dependent receptor [Hyphomonadaceae bacterium]